MTNLERTHVCDGCRWRSKAADPVCTSLHTSASYARRCSLIEQCLVWEGEKL